MKIELNNPYFEFEKNELGLISLKIFENLNNYN